MLSHINDGIILVNHLTVPDNLMIRSVIADHIGPFDSRNHIIPPRYELLHAVTTKTQGAAG